MGKPIYCFDSSPFNFISTTSLYMADYEGGLTGQCQLYKSDQDFYYFQMSNPAVIYQEMTRYLKYYIFCR